MTFTVHSPMLITILLFATYIAAQITTTTSSTTLAATKTGRFEAHYTNCHTLGTKTYCIDAAGKEIQLHIESTRMHQDGHLEKSGPEPTGTGEPCHPYAGNEHCVGGERKQDPSCDAENKRYNVSLRIGLIFVILLTNAIGIFTPIIFARFNLISHTKVIFAILKQFGTGVVISTAFIHLYTHANLMFANKCLGELKYEGTSAAIFMAGLLLSFLSDYLGARFVQWRQKKRVKSDPEAANTSNINKLDVTLRSTTPENERDQSHGIADTHGPMREATPMEAKLNVMNLEAGIIFHSILIGITLVITNDSFFITLFIVILLHQMFEGIALGTCIAELPAAAASTFQKCIMAAIFAFITPIGMAIGIGVLNKFNGNDPSTIVVLGTLDALSAGILAWVGVVEMLARDWLHGTLATAGLMRTVCAMMALMSGMVVMSVLGKWA